VSGWWLRRYAGSMVSSLRVRNYRLYFIGQLISMSGTWVQTVAQSFLVLQLTNSGTALGFAIAARFLPILVFGPWGGMTADRLNKRRVLYVTQALSGVIAATLGLLVSTHEIRIWMVYVLALTLGGVNVFDNPARQAFITELVPASEMANAVTLNSVTANMARILGAALGGVISATIGVALCFEFNAGSFLAVVIMLLRMSGDDITPSTPEPRAPGQIRAGLRYVRARPELHLPLLLILVAGTLAWEFEVSLPLLARTTFDGGPETYALMTVMMGTGAVFGGLVAASRTRLGLRRLAYTAMAWGAVITAAALMPTLALECAGLFLVGYCGITFNAHAKTTLQLHASPQMRGRVMALWALAWMGTTPLGGPIIGWVSSAFGARFGLLAGGVPTIAAGLAVLLFLSRAASRDSARPPKAASEIQRK
jgi:MFS family permease